MFTLVLLHIKNLPKRLWILCKYINYIYYECEIQTQRKIILLTFIAHCNSTLLAVSSSGAYSQMYQCTPMKKLRNSITKTIATIPCLAPHAPLDQIKLRKAITRYSECDLLLTNKLICRFYKASHTYSDTLPSLSWLIVPQNCAT